jgi:2-dehydro-3-deoxy-D-arabinonate dehydratase
VSLEIRGKTAINNQIMKILAIKEKNGGEVWPYLLSDDGKAVHKVNVRWDLLWLTPDRATLRQIVKSNADKSYYVLSGFSGVVEPPFIGDGVMAAGVTYLRSQNARREESGTPDIYTKIYEAGLAKNPLMRRPELFHKAPHRRHVTGNNGVIRIRKDSAWNVPETELALIVNPRRQILGYTICDDMSSRDIEGANPLYLPQAKTYFECCGLGPWVYIPGHDRPLAKSTQLSMSVARSGRSIWRGQTTLAKMARTPEDLVDWLFREDRFPQGVILSTGTGIVPPKGSDFTLHPGDVITMKISEIGTLKQTVVQG